MARVLIVYPNMYDPCMPIGITSLSSYLKNAGHEVRLFDTTLYKIDDTVHTKPEVYIRDKVFKPHKLWYEKKRINQNELYTIYKDTIESYDPDVIGISIGAQDMLVHGDDLINWAADIKRKDTILAVGGVIPSCLPDRFIDKADAVCVGEGELSLLDIVNGSREIVHGKVVDVDELLYPDWDLMSEMYMWWPFGTRVYRFGRFMRTRGCNNRCTYCSYSNPDFPRDMARVRRKSNRVMIDEIVSRLDKYKLEFITFVDDNFLVGSEDTNLEFLDMYREKVHLPFLTTTHPGTMTPDLAKAMKDAGSIHISMAIESGNEYIRRNVLGRKIKDEVMIDAFRLVKDQGIHCASLNMIGLPHETPEFFRDTIDLNRKCMPDKSMCYYFQPYIGLPLREEAIRYGYITGKEQAVNMCDESIMKLPGFPMRTMRNYKETFNIRIRFPKFISGIMGWLAGRSQFLFNILSKYKADRI